MTFIKLTDGASNATEYLRLSDIFAVRTVGTGTAVYTHNEIFIVKEDILTILSALENQSLYGVGGYGG